MDEHTDFRELLERAIAGSHEATETLMKQYGEHVLRTIRRRLHRDLRPKFDTMDFSQAVWASFYRERAALAEVDGPEAFVARMAAVARNKVIDEFRARMVFKKHNVRQERSLDADHGAAAGRVAGRDPSPSQQAIARELWDRMLEGQPERDQKILELRRSGKTLEEIAAEVQLTERTIRRILQRIERRAS